MFFFTVIYVVDKITHFILCTSGTLFEGTDTIINVFSFLCVVFYQTMKVNFIQILTPRGCFSSQCFTGVEHKSTVTNFLLQICDVENSLCIRRIYEPGFRHLLCNLVLKPLYGRMDANIICCVCTCMCVW